ncbi:MAG: hypothetical protein KHW69_03965, partial [Clostridium sp.]|nr:hypothetical protein [Clostridium sp.]
HSILREGHFSRKSPPSFQNLRTILFPLKNERFFTFSFAKVFLPTPGRTGGFVMLKAIKKKRIRLLNVSAAKAEIS